MCLVLRFILGPVAQPGERWVRNAEAEGSNPFGSTIKRKTGLATCFFVSSYHVRELSFLNSPTVDTWEFKPPSTFIICPVT